MGFRHGHLRLYLERHRHRPGLALPSHGPSNRRSRIPSRLRNHLEGPNESRCNSWSSDRFMCRAHRLACHSATVLWKPQCHNNRNGISNLSRQSRSHNGRPDRLSLRLTSKTHSIRLGPNPPHQCTHPLNSHNPQGRLPRQRKRN